MAGMKDLLFDIQEGMGKETCALPCDIVEVRHDGNPEFVQFQCLHCGAGPTLFASADLSGWEPGTAGFVFSPEQVQRATEAAVAAVARGGRYIP